MHRFTALVTCIDGRALPAAMGWGLHVVQTPEGWEAREVRTATPALPG